MYIGCLKTAFRFKYWYMLYVSSQFLNFNDDILKNEEFEMFCGINRHGLRDLHFISYCIFIPLSVYIHAVKHGSSESSFHHIRSISAAQLPVRWWWCSFSSERLEGYLQSSGVNFDLQVSSSLCPQSGYVYKNHFPSNASQMHACMKRGLYLRMQNNAPSETLMRVRVLSEMRGCTEPFK